MKTKAIVVSKIVWVNIIMTVLAVLDMLSTTPIVPPEYLPYLAAFAGVLNIVLRIWFTDSTLQGVFKAK